MLCLKRLLRAHEHLGHEERGPVRILGGIRDSLNNHLLLFIGQQMVGYILSLLLSIRKSILTNNFLRFFIVIFQELLLALILLIYLLQILQSEEALNPLEEMRQQRYVHDVERELVEIEVIQVIRLQRLVISLNRNKKARDSYQKAHLHRDHDDVVVNIPHYFVFERPC